MSDKELEKKIKRQEHRLEVADSMMVQARTRTSSSAAAYEDAYLKRMVVKAELDKLYDEAGISYFTEVLPKKSQRIQ